MDLWDLTKLIFRRWYFSLPVLLVTLIATLLVSSSVKPDYSAVGHLQMIPPGNPTPANPGDAAGSGTHNPWLDLGIQALGQAAVLKVSDQSVVKALVAQGLSGNFLISIDYPSTFFSVQVTGATQQQTTNTVKRVMELLSQDVKAEQVAFGVADRDSITTLTLDQGEKVTAVTSKFKRVLIVAGGISLLFTCGFTIGLDAIVRRWWVRGRPVRRVQGAADAQPAGEDPDRTVVRAAPAARPATVNGTAAQGVTQQPRPAAEARVERPVERPVEIRQRVTTAPVEEPVSDQTAVLSLPLGGQLGVFQYLSNAAKAAPSAVVEEPKTAESKPPVESRQPTAEEPTAPLEPRPMPSDATIVLPKTLDDWKQESRSKGR